jgi:hypothetical protein
MVNVSAEIGVSIHRPFVGCYHALTAANADRDPLLSGSDHALVG